MAMVSVGSFSADNENKQAVAINYSDSNVHDKNMLTCPKMTVSLFRHSERVVQCLNGSSLPPLDDIRVMMIVWSLRGNIIRTAPCWVV